MHSYAAFLGHQPHISLAELSAMLPDMTVKHWFTPQCVVFETARELDQNFLRTLGGTLIIARAVMTNANIDPQEVPSVLHAELSTVKGKATFALRILGLPRSVVRDLLRTSKAYLKQHNVPSRYIGNEHDPAKPIQLHDEGLLDAKQGCELVILRDKSHQWIGRTVGAQDVKAYTQRDIDKPVRDTRVGLLPPKLAQILLNFGLFLVTERTRSSKLKAPSTKLRVFDPFCGTGVIPLEAMLRGWDALASDVSLKAVNGCTKNVEWARKIYKIAKKDVEVTVWKQDATKPFALKEGPDVVVTEGSLGPALSERPTQRDAQRIRREIEDLAWGFLENAMKTLPGVPIVMTWPVWYTKKELQFLEKMPEIVHELEYHMILPPGIDPTTPKRLTLVYRRPDQYVGREIALLVPKGPARM